MRGLFSRKNRPSAGGKTLFRKIFQIRMRIHPEKHSESRRLSEKGFLCSNREFRQKTKEGSPASHTVVPPP